MSTSKHSAIHLFQKAVAYHRSMRAALSELHWLPIAQRIEFKVLTLMHGAVHNGTPRYLSDRISTLYSSAHPSFGKAVARCCS